MSDEFLPPQGLIEHLAKTCHDGCGISCGDRPCAGCMAGGMCDDSVCHCEDDESSNYYGEEDGEGPEDGGTPTGGTRP